jgi:mannosyltransferase
MGFVQRVWKRIPSAKADLPSVEEVKKKTRVSSRLAFFRRPLRLRGNSKFSIPLGVVLLFPCIVVILILVLVIRHSKSGVGILMPAGAPPAIRSVLPPTSPSAQAANLYFLAEKYPRSMTRFS